MKLIKFVWDNLLFLLTLFLLAFIPLYPKLPIVDVQNTWVYVRLEDFTVLGTIFIWLFLFYKKKVSFRTPLTFPIFIYWLIGAVSTIHGVMILFPMLSNVFPNVALLSLIRRIEYMSLFFVAFWAFKDKGEKYVTALAIVLNLTLVAVVAYGFGQHFLGFPAFLTMNEQFAKGAPITLSALSRVPSTFAGQYDLAAYLALIIPIIVSLAFGLKNLFLKAFFLATTAVAFGLLFLTVSRVSFIVVLIALVFLLIATGKKWVILSLIGLTALFLVFSPRLLQRFQSTVTPVSVLIDARTGTALGQVKQVPADYFKDKVVTLASDSNVATNSSSIVPFDKIPKNAELLLAANVPNGETLPQGTSYINLTLSPTVDSTNMYFLEKLNSATTSGTVQAINGDFVVKSARAYDLSFTTRFQGEWPNTLVAFERNVFLGSGFGSVSLAVDNDFLRALGETGILGFAAFAVIFATAGIFISKLLPKVTSPLTRSLALGFVAGTIGLILNAVLIDVFEASKIAFVYWLLMGSVLGAIISFKDSTINITKELAKIVTSSYAVILGLFVTIVVLFSPASSYYFVGDDFTWLRWVADCKNCTSLTNILSYFTSANGFFYRPATKVFFDFMYNFFWLNQTAYHFASIIIHFVVATLIFFISKKIIKSFSLSVAVAFTFVILSGYTEAVFWVSSIGFIFNAALTLGALLLFMYWKQTGKSIFLFSAVFSAFAGMFFHEVGVVSPLILIAYDMIFSDYSLRRIFTRKVYLLLLLPEIPYLLLRYTAQSHWFNGDYSYSLVKLPFNVFGNILGYLGQSVIGPLFVPIYEGLRNSSKTHLILILPIIILVVAAAFFAWKSKIAKLEGNEKKIFIFSIVFFVITLLPFLGLGNITSRYSYLPTFGVAIVLVMLAKRFYEYMLASGKAIALMSLVLVVIIFSSLHLFQLQSDSGDWYNAGNKTKTILTSLEYIYAHYSQYSKDYYLINVPIRQGDAWVFPVGLSDASWLDLRDSNVRLFQASSPEQAFNEIGSGDGRVFVFDSDGDFTEMIKTKSGEIAPFMQSPGLQAAKK